MLNNDAVYLRPQEKQVHLNLFLYLVTLCHGRMAVKWEPTNAVVRDKFFFKMGHFRFLFLYFCLSNKVDSKCTI